VISKMAARIQVPPSLWARGTPLACVCVCVAIGPHGRSLCPGRKIGAPNTGLSPETLTS
jgi:hypothetical protein